MVPIRVPSLRERVQDIAELVPYFLSEFCARNNFRPRMIEPDAMAMTIRDNGVGLLASREGQSPGLGLRIMKYRAEIIGATLQVEGDLEGGTVVTCRLRGGV